MGILQALRPFASLLTFWILSAAFGPKIAVAGAMAVAAAEIIARLAAGRALSPLFWLINALTLGLGAADLTLTTPRLIVYEAPISNLVFAAVFAFSACGDEPMLLTYARERQTIPSTRRTRRFFRAFTWVWAGYFVAKAALYLGLAAALPLNQALAARAIIGGLSLAAMIGLSLTQGRRLFDLCRRRGWLGPPEANEGTPR